RARSDKALSRNCGECFDDGHVAPHRSPQSQVLRIPAALRHTLVPHRSSSPVISMMKCARLRRARAPQKKTPTPSATCQVRRIMFGMEHFAERSGRRIVTVDNTTVDIARAIQSLSDADLVRLKALARLWTRGLPPCVGWADVLHEAITRALDGSRK